MRYTIKKVISTTPESRQLKDMLRGERDAEIIARTNYGKVDNILSYSRLYNKIYIGTTVLLDGRVFCDGVNDLDVYDPTNDTLTPCINGSVNTNYSYKGGVLLKDGRIFIPPYYTISGNAAQGRIYNPLTNIVTLLSRQYVNGDYAGGVALANGKVFLEPYNSTTALVLDIDRDLIYVPSILFTSSGSNGSARLIDGRVCTQKYSTTDIYTWNPVDDTVLVGSTVGGLIYSSGSCSMADGKIFIIFGSGIINLIYDPISNTSIALPSDSRAINQSFCSLTPDGRIFINCGNRGIFYNPNTNTYEDLTSNFNGTAYDYGTQSVLLDGRIMLAPTNSTNATSGRFCFVGNKLVKPLPTARVCSPTFNRV